MKLEQQVVSLALAQKLKELGVPQDCIFFWWVNPSGKAQLTHANEFGALHKAVFDGEYAAFTAAELGEILKNGGACSFYQGLWCCTYVSEDGRSHKEGADTEADARAKMLVYLLENKLITL